MIMVCRKNKKILDMKISYSHDKRGCSGNARNLDGQEQPDYISWYLSVKNQDPLQRGKQRGGIFLNS